MWAHREGDDEPEPEQHESRKNAERHHDDVKNENVENDGRGSDERKWNEAVEEEEHAGDQFDDADEEHPMRMEIDILEGACETRHRRRGRYEKTGDARCKKDESEQNA